ncbi:MAG: 2-phospho-L-lactate transferase [Anaerolineaceae bacterium]|nr:2-phospho-L-lactate transferase [Anaerolineaceae bacterium]
MALDGPVVCLAGGVGGSRLAHGLAQVLAPGQLTVIVNTADDFRHYGLRVCPDLDTVMYNLAGLADPQRGWGLRDDSVHMLRALQRLGEEGWFQLGDQDLATQVLRSHWLAQDLRLTEVTARLAAALGVGQTLLPMCDEPVATMVQTRGGGELDFQTWFVRERWQPPVRSLRLAGIGRARMTGEVSDALARATLVLLAPSNPWLSILPILAVPGLRAALRQASAPVVAVTPVIRGAALKGPAARLMADFGLAPAAATVCALYGDILDAFVYDERDAVPPPTGLRLLGADTVMDNEDARARLAREILDWTATWRPPAVPEREES